MARISVFSRIGISERQKADSNWNLTSEYLLQQSGGDILMVIKVETAHSGYPSVEFTVIKTATGEILLFAENLDDLTEYSDPTTTKRFYPAAKRKWIESFPEIPFPELSECKSFWRKWLVKDFAQAS